MTARLLRKPPTSKGYNERLKITLAGNHTMKQKACMLLQAKFYLHEQGLGFAGPTDIYIPLIDQFGHPLTAFRDGQAIADYILLIESPYHCAADEYDRRQRPSGPSPF